MLFILEDNDERITRFQDCLGSSAHRIERTVPESIAWLEENREQILLYSLDNDLYVPGFEGDEGEGRDLCDWILANCPRRPVIVHSTNSHASTVMEMACQEAGWEFNRVVPYNGFEWIPDTWIHRIRKAWPKV